MINRILSIYILAFSSGFYSGFSKFALSMWLKDGKIGLMWLNLFSWTMLPSVFSVFWLPLLEGISLKSLNFGGKKSLIVICDFCILIMTFCYVFFDIAHLNGCSIFVLMLCLTVYAALIASRDSMAIGYKMEFIEKADLINYDGIISACYQFGLVLSTSGLLFLASYVSWSSCFLIVSSGFFVICVTSVFMENSAVNCKDAVKKDVSWQEKFYLPYRVLVKQNRDIIVCLIGFLLCYNLIDRLLVGNLNYYMLDMGCSKVLMANLKLYTGFLSMMISVANVWLTRVFGLKKMLVLSCVLYSFVPILIVLDSFFNIFGSFKVQILSIIFVLDKIFKSLQGNAFFSYQMQFCTKEHAMSQRSLFVLLERGVCLALAPFIGFVLSVYGYSVFFFLVSCCAIPALGSALLLFYSQKKN